MKRIFRKRREQLRRMVGRRIIPGLFLSSYRRTEQGSFLGRTSLAVYFAHCRAWRLIDKLSHYYPVIPLREGFLPGFEGAGDAYHRRSRRISVGCTRACAPDPNPFLLGLPGWTRHPRDTSTHSERSSLKLFVVHVSEDAFRPKDQYI